MADESLKTVAFLKVEAIKTFVILADVYEAVGSWRVEATDC